MGMEVAYPPPTNVPLWHPTLGICFCVPDEKGKDGIKIRSARHGGELLTIGADVRKGWEYYNPSKGSGMFHVFEAKLANGTVSKVGAEGKDEQTAKATVRAKLGLDENVELTCVDCIPNAATAKFEELGMNAANKVGGDDSVESMQKNLQPAAPQSGDPRGAGPVDPKLGFDDPKMQPPGNKTVQTADGTQPAQAPTDPSAPVVAPEGTASQDAPATTGAPPAGPNLTVR